MTATTGRSLVQSERQARDRSREKAFRVNLVIFLSVNALLLLVWVVLTVAGVRLHSHLWPWPVLMVLWGIRIGVSARNVHRERSFSEEQIQREMRR
ncbi:MAG: 2TM domain-containing protein [Actinomycetota bacterium]